MLRWQWRRGLLVLLAALLVAGASGWALLAGAELQRVQRSIDEAEVAARLVTAPVIGRSTWTGVPLVDVVWLVDDEPVTITVPDPSPGSGGDELLLVVRGPDDRFSTVGGVAVAARPHDAVPAAVLDRLRAWSRWVWPLGLVGAVLTVGLLTVAVHFLVPDRVW